MVSAKRGVVLAFILGVATLVSAHAGRLAEDFAGRLSACDPSLFPVLFPDLNHTDAGTCWEFRVYAAGPSAHPPHAAG
jgi:hypothetical protein